MPEQAVDGFVAAATTAVALALLAVSEEPGQRAPDALGYVLLAVAAAPLAVRSRWPSGSLAATTAATIAYLMMGYAGGPVTVPVLVALYSTTAWGRRVLPLVVLGFFVGVGSGHRLIVQQEPFTVVAFQGLLYVFAWLLGELVSSRRALRAEVNARLRRAAQEREREAERRVQQERMRIARELHDVMAHTMSSMTVQAGVAADLLDDRPDQARSALAAMRRAGREAMAELRATVSLLRSGDDGTPPPPAPGLADVGALVDRVSRDGLSVEQLTVGQPRPLPAAVGLTGYRIVQEALTNVVRHAAARTATVCLRYEPDGLTIEVTDDGRGAGRVQEGFGLLGMRERAEAVGGRLEVGAGPDGGFCTRAYLPTGEDPT
ncbi:MAG TPA: sensor histidine kinase [Egibacteraceae bacterium]|nr:sensor histidine kinase [Egibacteraceae bacterium]